MMKMMEKNIHGIRKLFSEIDQEFNSSQIRKWSVETQSNSIKINSNIIVLFCSQCNWNKVNKWHVWLVNCLCFIREDRYIKRAQHKYQQQSQKWRKERKASLHPSDHLTLSNADNERFRITSELQFDTVLMKLWIRHLLIKPKQMIWNSSADRCEMNYTISNNRRRRKGKRRNRETSKMTWAIEPIRRCSRRRTCSVVHRSIDWLIRRILSNDSYFRCWRG